MISIDSIKDIEQLIHTSESGYFNIDPDLLVDPNIFKLVKKDNGFSFHYIFKKDHAIFISVEDKIIRKINFTKQNEKGFYTSFRENDLPTILIFDQYLNKNNFIWKNGNNLKRTNEFKPTSIKFNKDFNVFSYSKSEKSKIYPSYINFSNNLNKIIGCIIRFYDKELNITNVCNEFPDILNIKEDDCYDLSKNIFTKEILKLKEIVKY